MKGAVNMRTKESIGVRMHQYRACYAMILPFFLLFGIFSDKVMTSLSFGGLKG